MMWVFYFFIFSVHTRGQKWNVIAETARNSLQIFGIVLLFRAMTGANTLQPCCFSSSYSPPLPHRDGALWTQKLKLHPCGKFCGGRDFLSVKPTVSEPTWHASTAARTLPLQFQTFLVHFSLSSLQTPLSYSDCAFEQRIRHLLALTSWCIVSLSTHVRLSRLMIVSNSKCLSIYAPSHLSLHEC